MLPRPSLLLVLLLLAAGAARAGEERVVLEDGRILQGEVTTDDDLVRITSPLAVWTVPADRVARREPVPALDAAPFVRLATPIVAVDPRHSGPPVPPDCRPRAASQFSADGRIVRRMEHPKEGQFDVTYLLTEVHPTHFVLEGIEREHRLHHACEPRLARFLHGRRAQGVGEDDAVGWLELARLARLAGWFELAAEDQARAGSAGAEAAALEAEAAALTGARVAAAAADALAARDREQPADGLAALDALAEALGPEEQALRAELAAEVRDLEAVRARLAALGALSEELAAPAAAEAAALTAAAARRALALLGPEPPSEREAAAAELALLRASRRYGAWLEPGALRALDLAALAAAEEALAAVWAARHDPPALEAALRQQVAPLEARLPFPVWEALLRGGAGAPLERPPAPGARWVRRAGEPDVRYYLHVPPSYRPEVAAPLVLLLNGLDDVPADMLTLWGAFADRHGLLLASIDYLGIGADRGVGWHFAWEQHGAVRRVLEDVGAICSVDPERVYLAGHSVGGLAAYDLAYSHPDWFAGVIPMIGAHVAYGRVYAKHAKLIPVYAIGGEHDQAWAEEVRDHVAYLASFGADVTYAEYKTRGHELFWEELVRLPRWLRARRRQPFPERLELAAGRPTDLDRFWVRVDEAAVELRERPPKTVRKKRLVFVEARVDRRRNEVRLDLENVRAATLLLSDRLLDLDQTVRVRAGRKTLFTGEVTRSVQTLVRRFAHTGDRAALCAAELELKELD